MNNWVDEVIESYSKIERIENESYSKKGRIENSLSAKRSIEIQERVLQDMQDRIDGKIKGIKTGYTDLDTRLGELENGQLVLLAGRPGMCKSMLAQNILENIGEEKRGLFISYEMSELDIGKRELSRYSGIELERIRNPHCLTEIEFENIIAAVGKLKENKMDVCYVSYKVNKLCEWIRELHNDEPLSIVVIDYVQLMMIEDKTDSRQYEIGAISRQLKLLAGELNFPIILVSQLSREAERRSDHRPFLSDLRDSGALEQDADIILLLYRDDYYDENSDRPNILEVNIGKQRNGSTGTIYLHAMKEMCDIRNSSFRPTHLKEKYSFKKSGFE